MRDETRAAAPLRWAGSKKRSLNHLRLQRPQNFSKYIELFAGSACLLFDTNPSRAALNDSNKYVINFYMSLQKNAEEIFDIFIKFPRTREFYAQARIDLHQERADVHRAALFYFLNRNCFNGIFRTNKRGHFNVPFSSSRVPAYPDKQEFLAAAKVIQRCEIGCYDFEEACRLFIEPNSFVYLDPPYYVPKTRVFAEYSAKPFCSEDFDRLNGTLDTIDSSGSYFLLSYPDCQIARDLGRKWNVMQFNVRRIIASKAHFRENVAELLISNFCAP